MRYCNNCGAPLAPDALFCTECGSKNLITCHNCGAQLPPDCCYCTECGVCVDTKQEELPVHYRTKIQNKNSYKISTIVVVLGIIGIFVICGLIVYKVIVLQNESVSENSGSGNNISSKKIIDEIMPQDIPTIPESEVVDLYDEFSNELSEKAELQQKRNEEDLLRQKEDAEDNYGVITRYENPVDIPIEVVEDDNFFDEDDIFQVVEEMPEFPGGEEKLLEYLGKNIHYPERAREQGVQGRCIIEFVIERDGTVTEPKIVRSLESQCDNEAVRVIKSLPKWKPGKQKGKPVRVKYTVPVQFKLT